MASEHAATACERALVTQHGVEWRRREMQCSTAGVAAQAEHYRRLPLHCSNLDTRESSLDAHGVWLTEMCRCSAAAQQESTVRKTANVSLLHAHATFTRRHTHACAVLALATDLDQQRSGCATCRPSRQCEPANFKRLKRTVAAEGPRKRLTLAALSLAARCECRA